jgi:hypothetical protein
LYGLPARRYQAFQVAVHELALWYCGINAVA